MQSFSKGFKPKSKRVEGKIRGPGTGTSDDIKAQVPEGSYIMPADSTRAIGEQNLAGMGAPVDINVSNGEFALPPEQVHAVGVQALNQMRDQTHTPTGKPQVQGSAERPELFFADGGVVDEEKRKKPNVFSQFAPQTPAPTPMAPQQKPAGVIDQAMDATQRRMNDPILQNAPRAPEPEQATLGSVMNAGPGTANVGPFKVSHLPSYNQGGQDGSARGVRALMGDAYPGWDANGQATGIFKRGRQTAAMAEQDVADSLRRGDYAHAAGKAITGALATGIGYGDDIYQENIKPMVGAVTGGVADFFRGATGRESGSVQDQVAAKTRVANPVQANRDTAAVNQEQAQVTEPAQSPVAQAAAAEQVQTQADPAQFAGMANNIIREGNSFSASGPIGPGYTINGQPQGSTNIMPGATGFNPNAQSAQNNQAKAALFDRTPEFGQGAAAQAAIAGAGRGFNPGGSRVTVVPDIGRMESERRRAFAAASTPHAGAQNRQLTAAQINAMRGLISDERTADNQRYATDASLTREEMSQAGADRRAASRDAIDLRRVTGDEESRGFQNRAAARVERLYEKYEQASTPEEKSAIAEQLRVLSGDSQAPRFAVAAGGQIIDPTTQQLITQPAQIFNTQTGEFVQQQGTPGMQAPPSPGEVRGGYRFKGGNPADQKNWEKI